VVDQRPEELIAAAVLGVRVQYAAGLGPLGNCSSLRFSVDSMQFDNQIFGSRCARHSSYTTWQDCALDQLVPYIFTILFHKDWRILHMAASPGRRAYKVMSRMGRSLHKSDCVL
jgi:hypothetical protein